MQTAVHFAWIALAVIVEFVPLIAAVDGLLVAEWTTFGGQLTVAVYLQVLCLLFSHKL